MAFFFYFSSPLGRSLASSWHYGCVVTLPNWLRGAGETISPGGHGDRCDLNMACWAMDIKTLCYIEESIINRPGVAGAIQQTPLSFNH